MIFVLLFEYTFFQYQNREDQTRTLRMWNNKEKIGRENKHTPSNTSLNRIKQQISEQGHYNVSEKIENNKNWILKTVPSSLYAIFIPITVNIISETSPEQHIYMATILPKRRQISLLASREFTNLNELINFFSPWNRPQYRGFGRNRS